MLLWLTPGIGGGGGGGAGGAAGNSVNGGIGIQLPPLEHTQPTATAPGTYGGGTGQHLVGGGLLVVDRWWYTDDNYPISAPYGGPVGNGGVGGGGIGSNPPKPQSPTPGQANTGGWSNVTGGSGIAFFYYPIAG